MTNFTWKVTGVECLPDKDGLLNVIDTVAWSLLGSNAEHSTMISGKVKIPFDPEAEFIPYPSLTEADVLSMVLKNMKTEEVDAYKAAIDAHLVTLVSPPIISPPLPW